MKSMSSNEEEKKAAESAVEQSEKRVIPLFEGGGVDPQQTNTALDRLASWFHSLWKRLAFSHLQSIDRGSLSLVAAAMQRRFSFWLHLVFAGCFKSVPLPETDILRVRECAKQGAVVYVM